MQSVLCLPPAPDAYQLTRPIELSGYVPEGVLRVGLFLDQDRSEIEQVVSSVPLDILQFHGSETEQECSCFNMPWLKAVAMENAESVRQAERDFPGASGCCLTVTRRENVAVAASCLTGHCQDR